MTRLYAQPYNIDANGFFFETEAGYFTEANKNRDRFGNPVEEYEIQFIEGGKLDAEFARAFGLNQSNFAGFLRLAKEWQDHEKIRFIIAVGECGYDFDPSDGDIDRLDIDIYEVDGLTALAERFVEEGLFGEIPDSFLRYVDYDAVARDLAADYRWIDIASEQFVYRCA